MKDLVSEACQVFYDRRETLYDSSTWRKELLRYLRCLESVTFGLDSHKDLHSFYTQTSISPLETTDRILQKIFEWGVKRTNVLQKKLNTTTPPREVDYIHSSLQKCFWILWLNSP